LNQTLGGSDAPLNSGIDHAESAGPKTSGWHGEIRMIEQIEELGPELDPHFFADVRPLENCEIKIIDSGAAK
jgi:hypothetical protein